MHFNALDLIQSFAVALPAVAISLVAFTIVWSRLKEFLRKPGPSGRRRLFASSVVNAAMALTFLSFASTYRPALSEVAKAQISQQEEVDEDNHGDPEASVKGLHHQLRRIRRGEKVRTLFLRKE